jgi:hypothetical protein
MAVNLVVQDGVVKSPALRYATDGKVEFRFTLAQIEKDWPLYLPCCAVSAAAERLAAELDDGMHIVITSGKLVYRKRSGFQEPDVPVAIELALVARRAR